MNSYFIHSDINQPYQKIKAHLESSVDEVVIFSPYVTTKVFIDLIEKTNAKITLITSWNANDILYGASDPAIYEFTKERKIQIFLNDSIHLKAYLVDWCSCIFGSANLTGTGLSLSKRGNYELCHYVDHLDPLTLFYLRKIKNQSIYVDDELYEKYKEFKSKLPKIPKIDVQIPLTTPANNSFLISMLPMSTDVNTLYSVYASGYSLGTKAQIDCAMHDIALFEIPGGLSKLDYFVVLKDQFFKSPFIIKLLEYINQEDRYFGRVKDWVQENCIDVPIPSKRDLTENIQVLYKWIEILSEGKYIIDAPNHSQRIRRA